MKQTKLAQNIDFIGDIHGNGTALIHLLKQLGYEHNGQAFSHPEKRVIFLGDFIDGNAELKQHRLVLDNVMSMIYSIVNKNNVTKFLEYHQSLLLLNRQV